MKDFFISYTGSDAATARLLRQWLVEAGHSTYMQEPDFPPTSHIPEKIEEGMKAHRLLAVLSPNYLNSDHCRTEFGAALMRDPLNRAARLVIVRIAKCEVPELWATISRIELLETGSHIRELFLTGIRQLPPVKRLPKTKSKPAVSPVPIVATAPLPAVVAQATGDRSFAAAAARDVNFYYGDGKGPRGRAKPPPDVVTEEQAVQLQKLITEVIELDSGSPEGKKLTSGELKQKWWGALGKVVPKTTYRNYSQAKFNRAMKWLREQRGRLIAGVAEEQPELARSAMIRAIHTYLSRSNLNKRACYNEWSKRLGISPAFGSSKDLSDYDLKRVYDAMRRDKNALES